MLGGSRTGMGFSNGSGTPTGSGRLGISGGVGAGFSGTGGGGVTSVLYQRASRRGTHRGALTSRRVAWHGKVIIKVVT